MPKLSAVRQRAIDGVMKQALHEATVAVLSAHGFDGLTMDRVAAEAGVGKGSLYRYFRSKRELLEFVYARLVDPVLESLEEIVTKEKPAVGKLSDLLHVLLEHVAQYGQVHKLLFENQAAEAILQPSKRCGLEVACQRLAPVFEQGIADGVFRAGEPLMLASLYFGLVKSALEGRPGMEDRQHREHLHRMILGIFFNGIATEKIEF